MSVRVGSTGLACFLFNTENWFNSVTALKLESACPAAKRSKQEEEEERARSEWKLHAARCGGRLRNVPSAAANVLLQ